MKLLANLFSYYFLVKGMSAKFFLSLNSHQISTLARNTDHYVDKRINHC